MENGYVGGKEAESGAWRLFGRRANVSVVGSHRAGADGIWFLGCAVRSLPAAAPACRPSSLKPVLWDLVVVRDDTHRCGSCRESLRRFAPRAFGSSTRRGRT